MFDSLPKGKCVFVGMYVCELEFTSKTFLFLSLIHCNKQLEIGDHNPVQKNLNKLSTLILKGKKKNQCW